MNSKAFVLPRLSLVCVFLLYSLPAFAQNPSGQAGPGGDQVSRLQQELGLTNQQSDELRRLASSDQQQGMMLQRKISAAHRELTRAVLSGADQATVQAKADELKRLTSEMIDLQTREMRALAKILTPEQRQKLVGGPSRSSR